MTDNQQQQMTIQPQRSPGDIIKIGAGLGVVGLGVIWGLRAVWPELFEGKGGPGGLPG